MQSAAKSRLPAAPQPFAPAATAEISLPAMPAAVIAPTIPVSITPLSASQPLTEPLNPPTLPAPITPSTASATDAVAATPDTPAPVAALSCNPKLALNVGPSAMIEMSLTAPCAKNARVVILDGGLSVTGLTSDTGALSVELPAMASAATVSVRLPGGDLVTATAAVPEMNLYDRVAVQWMGDDSFALHALEFGANFGERGDISAQHPRTPSAATQDKGGFLTQLGDGTVPAPMEAQVYTFPTGISSKAGSVKILIEAPVTAQTCGHDMLAQTLQSVQGTGADIITKSSDLTLSMPACDSGANGQFVELTDLVPDMVVASR
ncbi:MAG: hypothetical protein KGH84_07945 [Paracoccaceae bacterium]|nr:hypothetical protein [Paracoccaceae bacterium]